MAGGVNDPSEEITAAACRSRGEYRSQNRGVSAAGTCSDSPPRAICCSVGGTGRMNLASRNRQLPGSPPAASAGSTHTAARPPAPINATGAAGSPPPAARPPRRPGPPRLHQPRDQRRWDVPRRLPPARLARAAGQRGLDRQRRRAGDYGCARAQHRVQRLLARGGLRARLPGRPRSVGNQGRQDQRDHVLAVELDWTAALAQLELGVQAPGQREERGRVVDPVLLAAHHPAKRVTVRIPRGIQDISLARVFGSPRVRARVDSSPQAGQIEVEDCDMRHDGTISVSTVISGPTRPPPAARMLQQLAWSAPATPPILPNGSWCQLRSRRSPRSSSGTVGVHEPETLPLTVTAPVAGTSAARYEPTAHDPKVASTLPAEMA